LAKSNVELLKYCGEPITDYQYFLNEARLSALAISLHLAAIRINPLQGSALRVLVLDDLLIGLDMSNRLPLRDLLKDHFIDTEDDFQIIMTTYDKVWFDLMKSYFENQKWTYAEMYPSRLTDQDFEIPIVYDETGFIEKSQEYLDKNDYKASAVYIRTEFERVVKKICDKKELWVRYNKNSKEIKSDDYWQSIKEFTNISAELVTKIESHRGTVMNPFSHYDLEKPEFRSELEQTIASVKELAALSLTKQFTVSDLKKKISDLENKVTQKENTIRQLNNSLNEE